jgi:hypothetical protein
MLNCYSEMDSNLNWQFVGGKRSVTIEEVMKKYEEQLMKLPNVTSVGLGEKGGTEVIIVFVRQKVHESELQSQDIIPKILEGYKTDVRIEIRVGRSQ